MTLHVVLSSIMCVTVSVICWSVLGVAVVVAIAVLVLVISSFQSLASLLIIDLLLLFF